MIYLILAIFTGGSVSLLMRYAENHGHNGDVIMFINYIASTTSSVILATRDGVWKDVPQIADSSAFRLFTDMNVPNTLLLLLVLGIFSGVYYMSSLVLIRKSYLLNGVTTTLIFSKSNFIIPTILSFILWREFPAGFQLIGAVLCALAIVITFTGAGDGHKVSSYTILVFTLLICGLMQVNSKFFSVYCIQDYSNMFLAVLYCTAMFVSLGFVIYGNKQNGRKFRITGKEWAYGIVAGICNFSSNWLQIKALTQLPAAVMFACHSAGILVFGSVIGWLVFKEKLSKKQLAVLCITVCGLALANIK